MDTIDDIFARGKAWLHFIELGRKNKGQFTVKWGGDEITHHRLHKEFMTGDVEMAGTCVDLKAAYKQCPVRKDQREFSVRVCQP